MPKVISRSTVSTSSSRPAAADVDLRVYYCICGEFILVIDKTLASLPRRKTDGAIILRAQDTETHKACVFKLNAVAGEAVLLEREGGHERQFRFHCPRCALPIGYQSTPPPAKSGPFVYILAGALSQVQGQTPADAFEGEESDSN
ncbi:hypothetical protein FB45DRAFT_904399 [Roridomyces roridus]|uniref:STEEP1 domain-containing protein n=1 Tax=Roridomyces roridus TaxID=1738132 RepID=A0AAD7FRP6_9AGAR|nr:hypothetical protein FB45DRAFT_904399 [Roridomyces roridus]